MSPDRNASTPQRPRVLIVEDEPGIRTLARAGLTMFGFDVDEADGVRHALAALAETSVRYEAVVVDLGLPDGNGETIALRVLSTRPSTAVLICSGSIPPGGVSHLPLLRKPYAPSQLAEAIRRAIGALRPHARAG